MEEADKILIDMLVSIGLELTDEVTTLENFSPDIFINATGLCLEIIYDYLGKPQSFPKKSPQNMASRYKVGQQLAEAILNIDYKGHIGYQSFLYPNIKDTRNILSFLIESLPKESGPTFTEHIDSKNSFLNKIQFSFYQNLNFPWVPHYCCVPSKQSINLQSKPIAINFKDDEEHVTKMGWKTPFSKFDEQFSGLPELLLSLYSYNKLTKLVQSIDVKNLNSQVIAIVKNVQERDNLKLHLSPVNLAAAPEPRKRTKYLDNQEEKTSNEEISENKVEDAEDELNEIQNEYVEAKNNYSKIIRKIDLCASKIDELTKEDALLKMDIEEKMKECELKEKTELVMKHGDSTVDKLQAVISKKTGNIESMEKKWLDHETELQEKINTQKEQINAKFSKTRQLEQQMALIKGSMEECRDDYKVKETQLLQFKEKVKVIIENQTVMQGRKDFTKRIFELTENKKKQNSEIKRILSEIFVLQKDINSLRGKLERSFIETNDCIFTEARKDEMSKKMYRVLVGIHDNCKSLVDVIEEKGKLLREIRDIETSLESENRENVEKNLEKITTDYEQAKERCENLKNLIKSKIR